MSAEEEIAGICAQLPELYQVLTGEVPALDRIRAALRSGEDVAEARTELTELLRAAGIADLGVRGEPHRRLGGLPPLSGHPVEEFYGCPLLRCTRTHLPELGPVPRCAVAGEPMRRERL